MGRISRVFRLARFSGHLTMIVNTVSRASDALSILCFFLILATTIFSALMWFAERGDWDSDLLCYVRHTYGETVCSPFQSVPHTYYWAFSTVSTVGYGDVVPLSASGRLICSAAMVCGLLGIAMPVSILETEFLELYAKRKRLKAAQKLASITSATGSDTDEPDTMALLQVEFNTASTGVLEAMECMEKEIHDLFIWRHQKSNTGGKGAMSDEDSALKRMTGALEQSISSMLTKYGSVIDELVEIEKKERQRIERRYSEDLKSPSTPRARRKCRHKTL